MATIWSGLELLRESEPLVLMSLTRYGCAPAVAAARRSDAMARSFTLPSIRSARRGRLRQSDQLKLRGAGRLRFGDRTREIGANAAVKKSGNGNRTGPALAALRRAIGLWCNESLTGEGLKMHER